MNSLSLSLRFARVAARLTRSTCPKCGGTNFCHHGHRLSFGSAQIRFENAVIAIVARREQRRRWEEA